MRAQYTAISLKRATALGVGVAVLVVHLMWRADATLAGLPMSAFVASIGLFAAEAFVVIALFFAAVAYLMPASVRPVEFELNDDELPTVDVFIVVSRPEQAPKATYSLAAAAQLDYPRERLRLHLVGVDKAVEGGGSLPALAARLKASWLAASPEASVGLALNGALVRTAGSLILVLNAGEAPTSDLLRRLAPGFVADPRLALCDIPAFAIDGDPVLADLEVSHRMPGDPGHFFKACLKEVAAIPGAFGAKRRTLWSRAALSASGGFARWGVTADAMPRVRIAQMGWRRALSMRPMIAALAPDSVAEYLAERQLQRLGTIDAALTRDPILARGLTMRERLSWAPAFFAVGMPIAWSTLLALPPLALLLQIPLLANVGALEGTLASLISLLAALSLAGVLHAGLGGGVIAMWSELLESLLSVPGIGRLLRGRRDLAALSVTPTQGHALLVILFAVALAGTTAGVAAWLVRPELHAAIAPSLAATFFIATILALLLGAIAEPRQRRLSPRVNRRVEALLLLGGQRYRGRLSDISVHGARFIAEGLVDLPARALAGKLTLATETGPTELPVQLSRQSELHGRSAFGLAFTGRTVGEFASVVRLAHRSVDRYADLCDKRAKPAGFARLVALLSLRGIGDTIARLFFPKPRRQRLAPAARKRSG